MHQDDGTIGRGACMGQASLKQIHKCGWLNVQMLPPLLRAWETASQNWAGGGSASWARPQANGEVPSRRTRHNECRGRSASALGISASARRAPRLHLQLLHLAPHLPGQPCLAAAGEAQAQRGHRALPPDGHPSVGPQEGKRHLALRARHRRRVALEPAAGRSRRRGRVRSGRQGRQGRQHMQPKVCGGPGPLPAAGIKRSRSWRSCQQCSAVQCSAVQCSAVQCSAAEPAEQGSRSNPPHEGVGRHDVYGAAKVVSQRPQHELVPGGAHPRHAAAHPGKPVRREGRRGTGRGIRTWPASDVQRAGGARGTASRRSQAAIKQTCPPPHVHTHQSTPPT